MTVPTWAEGSLFGLILFVLVVPFLAGAVRTYLRKQREEGTLASETLKLLSGSNQALAAERETSSGLQNRVLDLSARMVEQAQASADQIVKAVETIRDENRDGLHKLSERLTRVEVQQAESERHRTQREQLDDARRREQDKRDDERDEKIATLLEAVTEIKSR